MQKYIFYFDFTFLHFVIVQLLISTVVNKLESLNR